LPGLSSSVAKLEGHGAEELSDVPIVEVARQNKPGSTWAKKDKKRERAFMARGGTGGDFRQLSHNRLIGHRMREPKTNKGRKSIAGWGKPDKNVSLGRQLSVFKEWEKI